MSFYTTHIHIGHFPLSCFVLFWFWRNTFWKLAVYPSPVKLTGVLINS